ncbi:FAD-dependent monooxygenase [Dactylosporangium sp. NPDC049140]|uniref:FAD-dependent oxidoreductase n=1 Tax=Dactylosporangium sp. NPDC049140 TaxID=3155647 RepID=UPI0033FACD53
MRVLVVGGGVGGLGLAQGLRRRGVDVTVFERDAGPRARRQGYRLHLDTRATSALRSCLSPALFARLPSITGTPSRRVTVLTPQLKTLHTVEITDPDSTSVDRGALRSLLLAGLDGTVHFGSAFERYASLPGNRIRVHLTDGSHADGDVLVGADGIGSRVRAQYLPDARLIDVGTHCIYGRTPLEGVRSSVPPPLWDGFCPVTDRRRLGLALGLVRSAAVEDYVMWCLSARAGVLGPDLESLSPAALHALVAARLASWHPNLRHLIAEATVAETFALSVRSSVPCPRWTPTRVTLLGDAIHAMAPSQGSGANLALLDAARLCEALTCPGDLIPAIGAYETHMTATGFAAVRASLKASRPSLLGRLPTRR